MCIRDRYNAICELKKEENEDVCKELEVIANGEIDTTLDREICDDSQYKALGISYCQDNKIEMTERWDFNFDND